MRKQLIVTAAAMTFAAVATGGMTHAVAQNPSETLTIWSGVFTDIQARRGERLVGMFCAGCHGADLAGGDSGPKLVGPMFLSNWNEKTVGELFETIKTTMPGDTPGSLSPVDTANAIAFILEMNKANPGSKDLPVERASLDQIKIVEPPTQH